MGRRIRAQHRIHKKWIIWKSFLLFSSTEVNTSCIWNQSSRKSSQPNYRPCNEPPAGSQPRWIFMKWPRCARGHTRSRTRLLQMTELLECKSNPQKMMKDWGNKRKHTFVRLSLWGLWHTDITQPFTLIPTNMTQFITSTLTLTWTHTHISSLTTLPVFLLLQLSDPDRYICQLFILSSSAQPAELRTKTMSSPTQAHACDNDGQVSTHANADRRLSSPP